MGFKIEDKVFYYTDAGDIRLATVVSVANSGREYHISGGGPWYTEDELFETESAAKEGGSPVKRRMARCLEEAADLLQSLLEDVPSQERSDSIMAIAIELFRYR
jgi:hypothetical protein